jgi:TetR/AcrR family transcriptional repressor of mexJK operon
MTKATAIKSQLSSDAPRRRGRPRLIEVSALDERVLATARDLFYERGFSKAAMDMVATRAGISKGTLYSRFPNKSDLFMAVVEERSRDWRLRTGHSRELAKIVGLGDRLRYRAEKIIEAGLSGEFGALNRIVDAARPEFPELARMFYEACVVQVVDNLAAEIESDAMASGRQCRDARSAAAAFLAMIHGWNREQVMMGRASAVTEEERRAWVDRALALFFAGQAAW